MRILERMGGVFDRAGVYYADLAFGVGIYELVAVFGEKAHHVFGVRGVVGAAVGFDVDFLGAWD